MGGGRGRARLTGPAAVCLPVAQLPLDLYPKAFVMARHQVRELGVLEWKR